MPNSSPELVFHPLTADRWRDLESLFGESGAVGGCWCMTWRLSRADYDVQKGEGNRTAMKSIVDSGEIPGIVAYAGGKPVGWCSIAPREAFPRLERSRVARRVDDQPVWSVVCFFISRSFRRRGVSLALLEAAIDYARGAGAKIIEGYPVQPRKDAMPDVFAWTGMASTFEKAGFTEVARRSESRPLMRYLVEEP